MKMFQVKYCPVYDCGLCKNFKIPCRNKRKCRLKQTLNYCMKAEENIFAPTGYQNRYIVNVMGVTK